MLELELDTSNKYAIRREVTFLVLAGFFLCAMTMLNIIGITRFVELGPLALAVGVLPYPLTFLCTDIISELYGKWRANLMVTVGLIMNLFILGVMTLANSLPSVSPEAMPPWQVLQIENEIMMPSGRVVEGQVELFQLLYACTSGAMVASMAAYIAAQYCDVQLFHFWKKLTRGRHLWIRNNFSSLISQAVDSLMVVSITFGASFLAGDISFNTILALMGSNYLFKMCAALADTPFFYAAVGFLTPYLGLRPEQQEVVGPEPPSESGGDGPPDQRSI